MQKFWNVPGFNRVQPIVCYNIVDVYTLYVILYVLVSSESRFVQFNAIVSSSFTCAVKDSKIVFLKF